MTNQLHIFDTSNLIKHPTSGQVVNVASVPQRSPFRYPGGKTWAIPVIRKWLNQRVKPVDLLVEPFAGGGIVGLTAVAENLANHVEMTELDPEVAAVWQTITGLDNSWLSNRIITFEFSPENVRNELSYTASCTREIAFQTILKNRVNHGGILAKGSGMLKVGENGKGMASRWYPTTLAARIDAINLTKHKLTALKGDAFESMIKHQNDVSAYFFIDPPYMKAGRRLYTCFNIDHEQLFSLTASLKGKFLMTYDDVPEIRQLADQYKLQYITIPMKTTHHIEKYELLISDNFDWF